MFERHLACLGPSGFHRVVYSEWPGPAGAPTLVCVHGLSRNAQDFDAIAEALSKVYRVVCPDMPGRGRSEWLRPADYAFPLYLADCAALIARLDVERVDWLGTSMGALIGMMLAAQRAIRSASSCSTTPAPSSPRKASIASAPISATIRRSICSTQWSRGAHRTTGRRPADRRSVAQDDRRQRPPKARGRLWLRL